MLAVDMIASLIGSTPSGLSNDCQRSFGVMYALENANG
jgi:hypothetical protein